MKNTVPYIFLTWDSSPRSNENIVKFECVTAIIKNKDNWLYLLLEFKTWIFWFVWWSIEIWENHTDAVIREIEEESWYKNANIVDVIFEEVYARWYKERKDREEESKEKVFYVEVNDNNFSWNFWKDEWISKLHWLNEKDILDKISLDHHLFFFKEHLNKI